MTDSFKYDVAFSFLTQDEPLATRLNDLLALRLKTFLYAQQQKRIGGTDGEQTFNRVFGEEARIVVVLYRAGWGETPFTRIEETAIGNRGFADGYDFALFIPLDSPPAVPKWLPKNRMWVGRERWDDAATAAVIEARVQEAGGELRQETVADSARRLARELDATKRRKQFRESAKGVQAAEHEARRLIDELEKAVQADTGLTFTFERIEGHLRCLLYCEGFHVSVQWRNNAVNSLRDAHLILMLWKGRGVMQGGEYWGQPQHLSETQLEFDGGPDDSPRWRRNADESYSTADCADFIIRMLIDRVRSERLPTGNDRFTMFVLPTNRSHWG